MILESLDDRDTYAVQGDALQAAGDPRGELVALQIADPLLPATIDLARQLLGPLATPHYRVTWRWGYLHTAALQIPPLAGRFSEGDLHAMMESLLVHDHAGYLQRLTISTGRTYDGVLDSLAAAPLPTLRRLCIDDLPCPIERFARVCRALANLEHLVLRARFGSLGPLVLPQLSRLEIHSVNLHWEVLESIADSVLPSLEVLRLAHEGSWDHRLPTQLERILGTRGHPRLVELALNHTLGSYAHLVASSPLAAQLRRLDVSRSSLDDGNVHALDKLQHLDVLDVRRTQLTARGIAWLKAALPSTNVLA